jgi:hypothetical protein
MAKAANSSYPSISTTSSSTARTTTPWTVRNPPQPVLPFSPLNAPKIYIPAGRGEPTCPPLVDFQHSFQCVRRETEMHGIIYLVGLVVVVLAVLSLFGLR